MMFVHVVVYFLRSYALHISLNQRLLQSIPNELAFESVHVYFTTDIDLFSRPPRHREKPKLAAYPSEYEPPQRAKSGIDVPQEYFDFFLLWPSVRGNIWQNAGIRRACDGSGLKAAELYA